MESTGRSNPPAMAAMSRMVAAVTMAMVFSNPQCCGFGVSCGALTFFVFHPPLFFPDDSALVHIRTLTDAEI